MRHLVLFCMVNLFLSARVVVPSSNNPYLAELVKGQQSTIDFLLTVPVGKQEPVQDLQRQEQVHRAELSIDEHGQRIGLFKKMLREEEIQFEMAELEQKIKSVVQQQRDLEQKRLALSRELEAARSKLQPKK